MASVITKTLNTEKLESEVSTRIVSVNGPSLARNTMFNFAGQVLPLLAGVALIPYIVRGLGPDRFGMLGIVWVVFGYFSVVDLGLGRATTKFMAQWLAEGELHRVAEMVWNSLALQVLLGVAGAILIVAFTPLLVERVLKTPASLVGEARLTFYILAGALPTVLAMNGLRAVLEGAQRFDIANLLRIPSSMLAFAIPALAVAAGLHLPGIVLWMAISRVGFTLAHGCFCLRVLPCLNAVPLRLGTILPLLSFGGWVTAANLINPILLSMDRFLIGSLISVAMVGYYTAPFEAVTKLWMIPASLMTTVYPACSALGHQRLYDLQRIYSRSIKYIFCTLAPVSLTLVIFARPLIGLWLGPGFVEKSAVPLQLLATGVFINSFAHVPYCFLQALGRPDTTAKLFLLELLPYGLLAWWMIQRHGIAGAAAAWSFRVALEVLLLLWVAYYVFSLSATKAMDMRMWIAVGTLSATGILILATHLFFHQKLLLDASICAAWLAAYGLVVWNWVLDSADRVSVMAVLVPSRNALGKSLKRVEAD